MISRRANAARLLPWLGVALAGSLLTACTNEVEEPKGVVSLGIKVAPGGEQGLWGATDLHVVVQGEGLSDPVETTFPVDSPEGRVGSLEIPCSDEHTRDIYVEAVTGDSVASVVVARGAATGVSVPCGKDASVDVLLAPTGQFTPTAAYAGQGTSAMAQPRFGHTTTLLSDGRVMVTGGVKSSAEDGSFTCADLLDSVEIYDPRDGQWHDPGFRLKFPRAFHSATRLRGKGTVLILGGYGCINGAVETLKTGEVVYPWKSGDGAVVLLQRSAMFQARARHTATLHPQGWILVAGGVQRTGDGQEEVLADMEMFFSSAPSSLAGPFCDGRTSWAFCRTDDMRLASPRVGHAAAVVGHEILIIGGSDGAQTLRSVERFDYNAELADLPAAPAGGPSLDIARESAATLVLNDRVFLFGGGQRLQGGTLKALSSVEWYDPIAREFTEADLDTGTPRVDASAELLGPGGWVLISGGRDGDGRALSSALLMKVLMTSEDGTITWGPTGSPQVTGMLGNARFGHAMVRLDTTEQVLVVGGAAADGDRLAGVGQSELFTPGPEYLE